MNRIRRHTLKIVLVSLLTALSGPALAQKPINDLVMVPQCRIFDTRIHNVPLNANEIRVVKVRGPLPEIQGGRPNCQIPSTATGAVLMIALSGISTGGNMLAYDRDLTLLNEPPPNVSSINFRPPPGFDSSLWIISLCMEDVCELGDIGIDFDFLVRATANTHLVIDVTGYFGS